LEAPFQRVTPYTPADWYWYVGGNTTQAWSSKAGGYVSSAQVDPDRVTRIASATELTEVLDKHGLPGPVVLPDQVNRERDRRAAAGFVFNGKRFQSRVEDQKRISGAATLAVIAVMNGAQPGNLRWHGGDSDFGWIAEDNSYVTMDAQTVIAFGQAAALWEAGHVYAARALKDAGTIPSDYTADAYWP
jgi:hypothetical protein